MKRFLFLPLLLIFCTILTAAETVGTVELAELGTTRTGNVYRLIEADATEDGRISVVISCDFSEEERVRIAELLTKQGVQAEDAARLTANHFSLSYSPDGTKYQRLFDNYVDAEGDPICELALDSKQWYATPVAPEVLPARAYLEAGKVLGIDVSLPQPEASKESAASLQSSSPKGALAVNDLVSAYRADKSQFEEDYEYAVMQVRGVVGERGNDLDLDSLVLISETEKGDAILCCFDAEEAARLENCAEGDAVIIEGIYRKGRTPKAAFIMDRCSLIEKVAR